MPNNTITLKLEGDVSPEEFASAVSGFTQLLTALQRAVVPKSSIEWIVSDLHAGSASMTYAGSEDIPDAPNVEKLTREYFNAVTARANSEDINYPQPVVKALNAVIGVLNELVLSDLSQGMEKLPSLALTITAPTYRPLLKATDLSPVESKPSRVAGG